MKKRFGFYRMIALALSVVMLAGCGAPEEKTVEAISSEMTGFDDFYQGMWDGEPYVIVYGSQGTDQDTIRLKNFAEGIQTILEKQMVVTIPVKSDSDLSEEAARDSHLILIGNPETNTMLANLNEQLPIQVIDGNVEVPEAGWTIGEETTLFTYLVPNPSNMTRYVWVYGASHSDNFDRLSTMTMKYKQDEYMIKVDERTRYSGKFSKSSSAWTIPSLQVKKTINEFESVKSEHFTVRYDPVDQSSRENIEMIIEARELAYQEFAHRLGFEPEETTEIDIYMTEGIMEHYVGRDEDTVLGVIYEVHEQGAEDPAYRVKIAKVFMDTIGMPLDQMVRDGLATELASGQIYLLSSVHPEEAMREIIETDAYLPLAYMTGARINPDLDKGIVKEELRSFFHYLIETYGIDQVKALYTANMNMTIEDALVDTFDHDLLALEAEWLESLKR
jgi:hypothetical protein